MPLENYESEGLEKIPDLRIAQWFYEIRSEKVSPSECESIKKKLTQEIIENNMLPFYENYAKNYLPAIPTEQLKKIADENVKKLELLDEKIKDAETNLGDTEVRDAMIEKAHFFSRIGDKQKTLEHLNLVLEKTMMPGARLDCLFHMIRVGFFYDDRKLVTENIEKANKIIEEGGDWDRRNRLKVYRGLHHMAGRDFVSASKEFIHAVATFTSYELMDYKIFITYAVLTSMIALKRPELREKIIRGSEVQEVLHSLPVLKEYLMSLFECRYAEFFRYLTGIEQFLLKDRYLAIHARYYVKEMRILAYSQHLNSYRSINLESMAKLFGISVEFLDNDISRFISAGLLMCKIDKVNGIIETTQPDSVNFLYQSVIKQGDVLLNRIQKLSQVVNI